MGTVAVYPGSFDPVTLGHMDIIRRGAELFDHLIVAVATNPAKRPFFPDEERVQMLSELTSSLKKVEVNRFEGLVVHYAKRRGAGAILRGIRTFSDFEYEFPMALTNRAVAPTVETVFVMTSVEYSFISSRLIKEVAVMGGDVSAFIPASVLARLDAALARRASAPAQADGIDDDKVGWQEPEEGAVARPEDEGMR